MARGATILTALVLLLPRISRTNTLSPFLRVSKGIELSSGYMEVIEEERCSEGIVRLTCRSLRAFVFVLDAVYHADRTDLCEFTGKRKLLSAHTSIATVQRFDSSQESSSIDIRLSLNRRCSGQHHCRYSLSSDYPGAHSWNPALLRLKYACVPEAAVRKYCNLQVKVPVGVGGYLKSPGYPLYYPGGSSCGWTFRARPGQRIVLTFHDLSIRGPEPDGKCVDVVRVRENGNTIFEFCGSAAGVEIVSKTSTITLDLVASTRLYPARGFFLRYQVLGCPEVHAPNGSYLSNDTWTSRTFLCKSGTVFADSKEPKRTVLCRDGKWNESIGNVPACVAATSAAILKSEDDQNRLSSLSGDNILGTGLRIGRGEDAVAPGTSNIMDSAQSSMMKQADYVVDVVLPTVLIALLFVGNAIIVYIIFQYRKRKVPTAPQAEEMSLKNTTEVPQV